MCNKRVALDSILENINNADQWFFSFCGDNEVQRKAENKQSIDILGCICDFTSTAACDATWTIDWWKIILRHFILS